MPRGVKGSGPNKDQGAILPLEPASQPEPVAAESSWRPLGSVHVDKLSGDDLKDYARRAGVRPGDIERLSEDRLRQNTKIVIANHFELLTE